LGPALLFISVLDSSSGRELALNLTTWLVVAFSVLAHELAHAGAALALRIPVRRIALTWFGGFAEFWVRPTSHWHEAAVAVAGPAANLLIAALAFAFAQFVEGNGTNAYVSGVDLIVTANSSHNFTETILGRAAFLNLALGLFNSLPGLPLDGGHVLRAVLAHKMSYGRAGWIAAWAGQILGLAVIAYAVWIEDGWALMAGAILATMAWFERRAMRHD
jgi:Zn-dependent protease